MKILVTGSAGFIGHHTVQRLLAEKCDIVGLDNINEYYETSLKYARLEDSGIPAGGIAYNEMVRSEKYPQYHFIKLNLEDRENIVALFKREKFDYVIALAAQAGVRYSLQNPHAYIDSNVNGFMNLLEACRTYPVKHLIYASTSSVYGLNSTIPFSISHNTDHPVSLYAATKKANEMMAHSYSHLFNIPTTGLRFFTVYGPWGRPDMALFKFTKAIMQDQAIDVYNNGEMLRDFTYVTDIVENIRLLMDKAPTRDGGWDTGNPDPATSSAPYRILNIGNSNPVMLTVYIEAIEKALGKKAIQNMMPLQPGDVLATYADISEMEAITGFKPEVHVEEGVARFVKWYIEYYNRQSQNDLTNT